MPPQPVILESQNATSGAEGATIERRIRISQPDEGRARCKGSRAWDPRKDFSQPTQPPKTQKRLCASARPIWCCTKARPKPKRHRPWAFHRKRDRKIIHSLCLIFTTFILIFLSVAGPPRVVA